MTTTYAHTPAELAAAAGDPLLSNLTAEMRTWPDDALVDVRDTPVDRWTGLTMLDRDGRRCLTGIARGAYYEKPGVPNVLRLLPGCGGAAIDFDTYAERHGLSVVVPLIREAAAQILRERAWETAWAVREVTL